jgi:hypothetical protein
LKAIVNGLVASSFLAFFSDFFAMFLFPPVLVCPDGFINKKFADGFKF